MTIQPSLTQPDEEIRNFLNHCLRSYQLPSARAKRPAHAASAEKWAEYIAAYPGSVAFTPSVPLVTAFAGNKQEATR